MIIANSLVKNASICPNDSEDEIFCNTSPLNNVYIKPMNRRTRFCLPNFKRLGLALALATPLTASAQLALQQDDVVCLVGNALADRMQHDGWVETLIQSQMAGKNITLRNLAVAGDTVTTNPRSKGVPTPENYLGQCKADVVFAFFGYNESFGGEAKLAQFKKDLNALVDKYRAAKFNGETPPRIVLFSPIAHENLGVPMLPDGIANNVNLALYTIAIKQVASEKSVGFVDLFTTSQELYAKAKSPLTLNGVHLLPDGDRQIGEVIASAITGKKVSSAPTMEPLRQGVINKDWFWHNRFRAMDENDIWGSRADLRFVNGQSNRDALMHELTMLDVMTANRDKKIHAVAQGRDFKVDDSNVPKPVEVISNVGGGSKSSSAEKEGTSDYLSGKDSLAKIHVPEGFAVNLFADEKMFPALANPVQMQVDTKGRLWAACWSTYPKWEPLKEMTDSLLIMPDDNHDGVADKVIEFAKVHNPLGFAFWGGGVIVASQPDIIFLKDTDGDDKADVRIVLLQAIGSADTHHSANNFIIGPDGGLYWQSGIFLQHNYEHPWGPSLASTAAGMYRFDPIRFTITFIAANSPNSHGTSFDRWGYLFATDGTSGNAFQVRPNGNGFKMFPLLKKEVRPVPANEIISSTNFPDEMQQNFLICNTIGYLGLKRYELKRDGFTAGKQEYKQGEIWGEPTSDFLRSDDKNFRPTDAVFGEDGALYICDWQNVIIGHMQHNIRDPKRDKLHGRIFRMVCKDRPLQKAVAIDGQPITALLDVLKHPIDGVRERARTELDERNTKEVEPMLRAWMKQFDPKKAEDAHPLLEALWWFQRHDIRNQALLAALLESPEPHARIATATVKHFWGPADPTQGKMPTQINEGPVAKIKIDVPAHLTGDAAKAYSLGGEVFHREAHCATCHQPNGMGLDPAWPPLAGSPWVTGSEERLTKIALHGLTGKIEVNGKVYDPEKGVPPMTAFESLLNDNEMAAVLTYVRNSWGNKAAPVLPETVKKVRAATKDRSIFWKPEELLKDHPME
jgi:mono/diheme cytochrome c family protein/lysophospholipase L1-like esterase